MRGTCVGPYNCRVSIACKCRDKASMFGDTGATRKEQAARRDWCDARARVRVGGGVNLTALKFAAFGLLSPTPP